MDTFTESWDEDYETRIMQVGQASVSSKMVGKIVCVSGMFSFPKVYGFIWFGLMTMTLTTAIRKGIIKP